MHEHCVAVSLPSVASDVKTVTERLYQTANLLQVGIQFIYNSVLKMPCNSVKCRVFMLISAKYCDESVQSSLYIGNIDF